MTQTAYLESSPLEILNGVSFIEISGQRSQDIEMCRHSLWHKAVRQTFRKTFPFWGAFCGHFEVTYIYSYWQTSSSGGNQIKAERTPRSVSLCSDIAEHKYAIYCPGTVKHCRKKLETILRNTYTNLCIGGVGRHGFKDYRSRFRGLYVSYVNR